MEEVRLITLIHLLDSTLPFDASTVRTATDCVAYSIAIHKSFCQQCQLTSHNTEKTD